MINSKQLEFMSQQGTNETDPAQLTDINHVSIDTGLSATERMKAYLEQITRIVSVAGKQSSVFALRLRGMTSIHT